MDKTYWYRVTGVSYASMCDEFDNPTGPGRKELHIQSYPVLRTTPKGVVIELSPDEPRLVLHQSRNQYASPTKEQALKNFIARKKRQIYILSGQLEAAKVFKTLAEAKLTKTVTEMGS